MRRPTRATRRLQAQNSCTHQSLTAMRLRSAACALSCALALSRTRPRSPRIASKKSSSPPRAARRSCASSPAAFPSSASADVALVGSTHHSEIINRAAGRDDPAQQRRGKPHRDPLAGADRPGLLRRVPVSREQRADPADRILQRQRAVRSEHASRRSSIEVLRGPAGVVYGSGAMHGAINVMQATPAELPQPQPRARRRAGRVLSRQARARAHAATRPISAASWSRRTTAAGATTSGLEEQKLNLGLTHRLDDATLGLQSRRHESRPGDGGVHSGRGRL